MQTRSLTHSPCAYVRDACTPTHSLNLSHPFFHLSIRISSSGSRQMEHQDSVDAHSIHSGGGGGGGGAGGATNQFLTPYNHPHTFPVSAPSGLGTTGNQFGRKLSSASNFSSGGAMDDMGNGNGDSADHLYDAKPPKVSECAVCIKPSG